MQSFPGPQVHTDNTGVDTGKTQAFGTCPVWPTNLPESIKEYTIYFYTHVAIKQSYTAYSL